MKKVAVLQSNYIPWKGYFDIIGKVDTFIFYDDVQFTKNDWRNRNQIKTPRGREWLSIPVGKNIHRLINEVQIDPSTDWQKNHFSKIVEYYRDTNYFDYILPFLELVYLNNTWRNLSELNQFIIKHISIHHLNLKTEFLDSKNFKIEGSKNERLLSLLKLVKATNYLSGPAAANYIDPKQFESCGINLHFINYSNYPEYAQKYPPFTHNVSIIDLLSNCGENAKSYIFNEH